jgi:hypothetical protein
VFGFVWGLRLMEKEGGFQAAMKLLCSQEELFES